MNKRIHSVAQGLALLQLLGCSGPQPLSVAVRREHQTAYTAALRQHPDSPRQAFYTWKAAQTGLTVEQVAQADAELSTTRNPFNANSQPDNVSRGAVIYQQHCMTCHGEQADGRGPAMKAALPKMDFHSFDHRFAVTLHGGAPRTWFKKISEGYTSEVVNPDGSPNTMPAMKDVLAREQIWLAITYLQSLDAHAGSSHEAAAK